METGRTRDEAVIRAMEDCFRQGIMVDFINEHGTEVRKSMKNKSKLKKIRKGKAAALAVPAEWLYLNREQVSLRQIYELFGEDAPWKAEYWEEAGVLEIEIPEAGSVDMESMEADLEDEEGNAYLAGNQIRTVAAVTIVPEDFGKARAAMEYIIERTGGYFCGDTADFSPEVK